MDNKLIGLALLFLIGGLGIGYFLSLNQISTLQNQITSYETNYTTLTDQYSQPNTSYNNLLVEYTLLEEQVDYEVYFSGDRDYYITLMNDLQTASDSVYVALYSMKYDPSDPVDWANDLIRELVNAKNRGISVTVIIENTTYYEPMSENIQAYYYLLANGVDVQLDNDDDTDHMKFVVIDNTIVYVGSHNWSESSLYYNPETSVKIVSVSISNVFKDYFKTITN